MKSKEIELTEAPREAPKQKLDVPITFCTHVGWDGVLLLLFSLGISGLFIYIYVLYTQGFLKWHRPWVWVFMVLALLYAFLPLFFCLRWKKIAKRFRGSSNSLRKRSLAGDIFHLYSLFTLNGKYFLWKLYCFEFLESINQIVNMTSIYLCTLPVNVTSILCVVLCLDALHRAYQLRQPNTVARRDRQVKMDMTIDFICVALPLGTLWFLYKIPISIVEIIQVALWPSFCLHSKTRSLLREAIRVRTENVMFEDRQLSAGQKLCEQQQSEVPAVFSKAFCLYNVLYGVFFLVMALVHITVQPSGCDEIWSKGCENKIPVCTEVFTPSCNCASLKIENNKSLVTLPDSLVDDMQGLRKVFIRNCNLTALPPRMEKLTEMVDFEVSFNRCKIRC